MTLSVPGAPRRVLVSFADARMWRTNRRIRRQAEAMHVYDEVHILNESALHPEFRARYAHWLIPGSRGFGYWVWKPQVILQTLECLRDGDLLQYTDAGCHLRPAGRARLMEYFALAGADPLGLIAFQAKPWRGGAGEAAFSLPEAHWTKGDLLDHFGVRDRPDITGSGTIGAGILFMRKSSMIVDFIRSWLAVYEADFTLADDSPSQSPNLPGFREHRHDQSIFSVLCKLRQVTTLSAFEYWYPSVQDPTYPDWSAITDRPIWALRDKELGVADHWRQGLHRLPAVVRRSLLRLASVLVRQ